MITHTVLISFTRPSRRRRGEDPSRDAAASDRGDPLPVGRASTSCAPTSSYDLVLVTTHDDVAGLVAYQAHPVHQEFLAWLKPRLAARAVVDAES